MMLITFLEDLMLIIYFLIVIIAADDVFMSF